MPIIYLHGCAHACVWFWTQDLMNLIVHSSLHDCVHTFVCLWKSLRKKINPSWKENKDKMRRERERERERE